MLEWQQQAMQIETPNDPTQHRHDLNTETKYEN
jgi:hypothetical protein